MGTIARPILQEISGCNKCGKVFKWNSLTGFIKAASTSTNGNASVPGRKSVFHPQENSTVHKSSSPPQPDSRHDWIGPVDKDSNIRSIVYAKTISGNSLESLYHQKLHETQEWNQEFWKQHNQRFFMEKKDFIEKKRVATGSEKEVHDNLSIFYKDFLELNHDLYMRYNREWYQRNFALLWLGLRVAVYRLFAGLKRPTS